METPDQIVYWNGGEGLPWKSLEKALKVTGSNTEHVFATATLQHSSATAMVHRAGAWGFLHTGIMPRSACVNRLLLHSRPLSNSTY